MQKIAYFFLIGGVLLFTEALMDSLGELFLKASKVLNHFVEAVEKFGLPSRVQVTTELRMLLWQGN